MSATVWCRLGDGTEHEELHPNEEAANQALTRTLETHRKKGHSVSEQTMEHEPHMQYVVEDTGGRLVAMYQIVD